MARTNCQGQKQLNDFHKERSCRGNASARLVASPSCIPSFHPELRCCGAMFHDSPNCPHCLSVDAAYQVRLGSELRPFSPSSHAHFLRCLCCLTSAFDPMRSIGRSRQWNNFATALSRLSSGARCPPAPKGRLRRHRSHPLQRRPAGGHSIGQ
jgi:hypothetical protein